MQAEATMGGERVLGEATSRYVLFMICLVGILNYVDRQILSITLEAIKRDLGASDTQMGLLSGTAFALFYLTAGVPLARMADKGVRKTLLSACLAVWSLMTVLSGMAQSLIQLTLARAGVAAGEAGAVPLSQSMVGDLFPATARGRAQSALMGAQCVGVAGGMFLGGWLSDMVGWRAAFLILGAPGLLLALVFWRTVPEPPRGRFDPPQTQDQSESFGAAIRGILAQRSSRLLLLGLGLQGLSGFGLLNWAGAYMIRTQGLSASQTGLVLGLCMVLGLLTGSITSGFLADRLMLRDSRHVARIAAFGAGSAAIMGVAFISAVSFPFVVATFFLFNMCSALVSPPVYSLLLSLNRPHRRATTAFIATFSTNLLGTALGPMIVGIASDRLSSAGVFNALGIAIAFAMAGTLIGSVLLARSATHVRRDLAAI